MVDLILDASLLMHAVGHLGSVGLLGDRVDAEPHPPRPELNNDSQ